MAEVFAAYLKQLEVLHRDMVQALEGLTAEALNWSPGPEINSLAVLVAHTAGSERYWIGDVIARDDSQRDRGAEFRTRASNAAELIARLEASLMHSRGVVQSLTVAKLDELRAANDEREVTVAWALVHALEHVAIHVGHAQLIRQWWDTQNR